jgi:hypothetical protein
MEEDADLAECAAKTLGVYARVAADADLASTVAAIAPAGTAAVARGPDRRHLDALALTAVLKHTAGRVCAEPAQLEVGCLL